MKRESSDFFLTLLKVSGNESLNGIDFSFFFDGGLITIIAISTKSHFLNNIQTSWLLPLLQ